MDTTRILDLKRRGKRIPPGDLHFFVEEIAAKGVTDAQLGAFAMAVKYCGMDEAEQTELTLAMRDSGKVLVWPELDGPVLDKHSTGGVGDWVSLALAPLVAACGAYVPMISGRGLGHTGGTLDKLESIPGYKVNMDLERFRQTVAQEGLAMIGQGPELAPADGRLYAVRDVTSTVESVPLIVSSILSKKLAEGLDGLVLDVKTGNGAFMSQREASRLLAESLCSTAQRAGVPCSAFITDMNQPLGRSAGNSLELREALGFLSGIRGNARMEEVVFTLAGEMLQLGGLATGASEARALLEHALDSGLAAQRFAAVVAAQGGPGDLFENPAKYLPQAPVVGDLCARSAGWVCGIDTRAVGRVVLALGGGRLRVEDTIDHRVGISGLCGVGDRVERGQPICRIHARTEDAWRRAADGIDGALFVSEQAHEPLPAIYESIGGKKEQQ